MIFEIFTEDGSEKLEYQDYLADKELVDKIQDNRRFFLNLGLRIFSFDRDWMEQHPKQKRFLEGLYHEWEINPARFFLPHCANSDDFDTESHRFINDASHVYTGFLAGNRFGKSTIAFVKALLTFGVIPCDKDWECFKDHGVKYREFTGPKEIAVASYNWINIEKTVWPQIVRTWIPDDELGTKAKYNAPKQTAFSVELTCGSIVHMMCMSQPQGAFESQALDGFVLDEQALESRFDGANARMRTRRKYSKGNDGYEHLTAGWFVCGATPHKVEGRADTGGGTWFEGMYNGTATKGLTTKFYKGDVINDVPDWIYPEREKQVLLKELDEAVQTNNKKAIRAIRSRAYGEFENTGGMVYDEWDDQIHVISGLKIEDNWSAFRCMDHGRVNPTACVWVAITPENDYIAFREYQDTDRVISENVANIVRMSNNTLQHAGQVKVGVGMFERYREARERPESETYIYDVLDGRSFRNPDINSRYTIGDIYKLSGLDRLRPAPVMNIESTVPIIKEMLKIDPERKHIITGKKGAPKLYVMNTCPNLIKHIKSYRNKEAKNDLASEKPHSKDDHDLDALRYGFMMNPKYMPMRTIRPQNIIHSTSKGRGYWIDEDKPKSHIQRVRRDPYTGY